MKSKISKIFPFLKKKWKWVVAIVIVLLLVVPKLLPQGFDSKKEIVETAKVQDLAKTVRATGTVTSVVDLELGFNNPGRVSSVNTVLGQRVRKGQILASLNAGAELGSLNQAYGALKAAEASLARTIEGSTTEEIRVAEVTVQNAQSNLNNTKRTQDILVRNAKQALFSTDLKAISTNLSSTATPPTISGVYRADKEDEYTVIVYATGAGGYASYTSNNGESGSMPLTTSGPVALGTQGLYIQFPVTSQTNPSNESWKIQIPNMASTSYSTSLSALRNAEENRDSAIASAQGSLDSAEASLQLKRAAARPSDVSAKEADVLIAQGRVQQAQGAYEDKVIRAPIDGTITKMDISVGENVDAKKTVIVLQDKGELFLEANINEGDFTEIKEGQTVVFTVDTLPDGEEFTAEVSHIDQSPTKEGSVVNYKIRAAIVSGLGKIQTGSTANLSILIQKKEQVLVVPTRAIRKDELGNPFVLLVVSEKKGKTTEQKIETGMEGDGAMTEVVSGLADGNQILFKAKE